MGEIHGLQMRMHQYQIVGRAAPTWEKPTPKIYRMKLFARNQVQARNKFWYFMKKICKAKKTGGEILAENEIYEAKPCTVKNFGIWLRYDSRSGTHNMYKEYRALQLTDAIGMMYTDMAGRHRAQAQSIQVIKTTEVANAACRRANVIQFHKPDLKYPVTRRIPLRNKAHKTTFNAKRGS